MGNLQFNDVKPTTITHLIIAGNVKESPGPLNRVDMPNQELEPGKCKIDVRTLCRAVGLSVHLMHSMYCQKKHIRAS